MNATYFAIASFLLLAAVLWLQHQDRRAHHRQLEWERQRSDQKVKHLTDQLVLLKVAPQVAAVKVSAPDDDNFISPLDDEALAQHELERIEP